MITQRRAERPPLSAGRRSRLALGLAMGKKSRAVPGRRPILQLSPPGPRSSTPGRDPEPEPDTEPDSTAAAAPSQPASAAPPATTTTATVTTAAAAPEDSPSEGKGAQGAPTLRWGVQNSSSGLAAYGRALARRETRARGLPPHRGLLRGARGEDGWGPQGGGRGRRRHLWRRAGPGFPSLLSVHARVCVT